MGYVMTLMMEWIEYERVWADVKTLLFRMCRFLVGEIVIMYVSLCMVETDCVD